jgi:hypothetical protein
MYRLDTSKSSYHFRFSSRPKKFPSFPPFFRRHPICPSLAKLPHTLYVTQVHEQRELEKKKKKKWAIP